MARSRILTALIVLLVLHAISSVPTQAQQLCPDPDIHLVLISGDGTPTAGPEDLLPPPLDDYSELLDLDAPPGATPEARIIEFPNLMEIISRNVATIALIGESPGDELETHVFSPALNQPNPDLEACVVEIWDSQFRPTITAVPIGTRVYWINLGAQHHRVMAEGSGVCNFDTGVLLPSESGSHDFDDMPTSPCIFNDPSFFGLEHQIIVCPSEDPGLFCMLFDE